MSSNHALIFGASGVSGWGTMIQALSYPTPTTFGSVTGLTNRPLKNDDALLPDDERIMLMSGVDLSLTSELVINALKAKVPHITDITHVFFYAYIHSPDRETLSAANTPILENALAALNHLCPNLKHFVLQTGGSTYGIRYGGPYPPQPFKESDARSTDKRLLEKVFYYPQVDAVKRDSEMSSSWGWTQSIPDAIIGFAPTLNGLNLARSLAIYFALWRKIHGPDSEVPFTGGSKAWTKKITLSPMDSVARFAIYAAMNSDKFNGKSFNVNEDITSWSILWPQLAAEFGVKGVPPTQDTPVHVEKWRKANKSAWNELEMEHDLKPGVCDEGCVVPIDGLVGSDMDRVYDNTARRAMGFDEKIDSVPAFKEAFRRFAKFKLIPPL